MHVSIKGTAKVDRRTKNLVPRLSAQDIAVIDHEDLDEVAAEALVEKHPRAIINARASITGRYANRGPELVLAAGIPLLDEVGEGLLTQIREGEELEIQGNCVLRGGRLLASGTLVTRELISVRLEKARQCLAAELDKFVQNTLTYALQEKDLILGSLPLPQVKTPLAGEHVLVVVRGQNFKEDLQAISPYLNEVRPRIIAVDGAADALLERGIIPEIIIGDMDSVGDAALRCGAELIVHAYPDGRAPGEKRLRELGLDYQTFPAPGTSEDIAMLLAFELGASLIVAVGTHSNMVDFLEKGRKGMGSTFLVRLKVGSILVDAKGVSKLYQGKMRARYFFSLAAAAMLPLFLVVMLSEPLRQFGRLFWMKLRIMLGF